MEQTKGQSGLKYRLSFYHQPGDKISTTSQNYEKIFINLYIKLYNNITKISPTSQDCEKIHKMYILWITEHQCLPRKVAQHGPKLVLLLCLGKCLSPTTEAVFIKLVTDESISESWRLGSVATVGDPRTIGGRAAGRRLGTPWVKLPGRFLRTLSHLIMYRALMKATWEIYAVKPSRSKTAKLHGATRELGATETNSEDSVPVMTPTLTWCSSSSALGAARPP